MDPETEKKPTFDISTILPILLAVFSLLGILLVFMIGRFNANRPLAPAEDTPTPFKYQLIGTEPGISTSEMTEDPLLDLTSEPGTGEGEEPSISATRTPNLGLVVTAQQGGVSGSGSTSNTSVPKTKTSSSAIQTASGNATDPIIILNPGTKTVTPSGFTFRTHTPSRTPGPTITNTPSRTRPPSVPTSAGTSTNTATRTPSRTPVSTSPGSTQVPLVPSSIEYDDSHPLIAYDGWNQVPDSNAYQSTLHVSNTADSTIRFRFTGQQLRLKFQGNSSLGEISIDIGGLVFMLDESNGTNEWVSAQLAQGTYTVTITHASGGSVNIDSILIPDLNTPTPSATATPTPTAQ